MVFSLDQRARALDLRMAGFIYKDIARIIDVPYSELIRFFNASDHARYSERSLVNTSKLKPGEPGELDYDSYDRKEEAMKAAIMWAERMGIESWSGRRK